MCGWEDDGCEPWQVSGPNNCTLVDAQQEFEADDRPYRQRDRNVRAPRRKEARDPDWRPLNLTEELLERAARATAEEEQCFEEERRRFAQEVAENPEGPFKGYNAAVGALQSRVEELTHRQVKAELRRIGIDHELRWSGAHLELFSRLIEDENYYRGHPLRTWRWMLRHARPSTYRRRWVEVRTGSVSFAR